MFVKESTSLVLSIHKNAKINKITSIKKYELHNTTVHLVNYLLLPNMVGIHYLEVCGQISHFPNKVAHMELC